MKIIINKEYINYIKDKRSRDKEKIFNSQMFPTFNKMNPNYKN